jgi:type IV pilus assembly protein PilV
MLKTRQRGSILIEGLVSILIFSVGVLALMGMQSVAIKNASQAQYRSEAALLAGQILNQMMVDQAGIANYVDGGGAPARDAWDIQVADTLPNGAGSIAYVDTPATPRLATITVTWRAPDEAADVVHQYVTSANIMPAVN